MTIHLVVFPAASGKTRPCLDRISQVNAANPMAPVWFLVPDRLQTRAIRRRLAAGEEPSLDLHRRVDHCLSNRAQRLEDLRGQLHAAYHHDLICIGAAGPMITYHANRT